MTQESIRQRLPSGIRRWIAGADELDPLESDPLLVGSAVKPAVLEHLAQEGNDALRAVLVHVGQVDLVAEENEPFVDLQRREDDAVGSASILAVVIEGLEEQLGRSGGGEVETDHFQVRQSAESWF